MSKAKKEVTQETAERVKDKVVKAIAEEVKIIQETVEDVKKEIAQNSLDEPVDDYMAPESIGIRKGDYPEQDPETTKTLWDLAEQAARLFEDKTFIRYEKDDEIYEKSYREFLEDSTKLGVWAEEISDVMGHRLHAAIIGRASWQYLAVMFATAGAGGIAIPMDVQLTNEAFVTNITKAETDVVFYDWEFHSQVSYIREHCPQIKKFVCLQEMKKRDCVAKILAKIEEFPAKIADFAPMAREEDCALIIFTSGTTGNAKGVMLSHRALIDNTFCTDEDADSFNQVILNVLPFNHVFCLNCDVFITMRYGSTLCFCGNLNKMLYYINLFQPHFMRVVPMMAKALNSRALITLKQDPSLTPEEAGRKVWGQNLKKLASGGGYLAPELAESLEKFGLQIGQGYGMSECSPKISVAIYDRPDKRKSVGQVVRGCRVKIVDGEIRVKSPSVMMGYYNDPERTRESLTKDGWLCTGDLGYVDREGFLYLTGRKKNLIILENGENVSPESIENLFDGDPLISDILIYEKDHRIAAAVYPNYEYANTQKIKDIAAAVQEKIRMISDTLPTYSRIADVTVRKTPFEKTSSRKIIRSKYFAGEEQQAEKAEAAKREAPKTEIQKQLFEIVTTVLGNDAIGMSDDFYENGLDSLGSVMLVEDIRSRMGFTITFNELLKNGSILKLEKLIESGAGAQAAETYPVRKVYPLTAMQKYFAYVIPGNTTGNLPFTFELDETVDLPRLKAAIEDVIEAHPGLKGIIRFDGKQLMLYRDDKRKIDIPIIKVTDEEWPAVKDGLLKAFRFDGKDQLFHIALYETETSQYMLFDVAHIMGDGITMNILLEDVNKRYAGEEIERETYTFYDYIVDDEKRTAAGVRKKNIEYYDNLLKGSRITRSILNRKERMDLSHAEQNVIRKKFDRLVKQKIQYFCRQNGISENVLFLTAFNYCTMLFSNENDIFTNSIHSGRTDGRWRRIAGPLFLTYYCRYQVLPHETTINLLKRTGQQIMDTMQNFISVPREGEMFFQYQGDIININEIGGAPAKPIHLQLDSLPFHMQVMSYEGGWYTELRYWENRFDPAQLEIFLNCYEEVVNAMLEERSARRLKKHISEEYFPKHFYTTAGELNAEAGFELIPDKEEKARVKVYVLDERFNKKPFGGWGKLYISGVRPSQAVDEISNPFRPGTLFDTGIEARILPDGRIDFLENSGRIVLTDGAHGRRYYDLGILEKTLDGVQHVDAVHAYLAYSTDINEMKLGMDVEVAKDSFINRLRTAAGESLGEQMIPAVVNLTSR